MNSASSLANESPAQAQTSNATATSWGRQMLWCVRREIWENRSIYVAPLAVAGLALVACVISVAGLPQRLRAAAGLDALQQLEILEKPFDMAGLLIMGVTFLVALFYCLDALYGERQDRSILF